MKKLIATTTVQPQKPPKKTASATKEVTLYRPGPLQKHKTFEEAMEKTGKELVALANRHESIITTPEYSPTWKGEPALLILLALHAELLKDKNTSFPQAPGLSILNSSCDILHAIFDEDLKLMEDGIDDDGIFQQTFDQILSAVEDIKEALKTINDWKYLFNNEQGHLTFKIMLQQLLHSLLRIVHESGASDLEVREDDEDCITCRDESNPGFKVEEALYDGMFNIFTRLGWDKEDDYKAFSTYYRSKKEAAEKLPEGSEKKIRAELENLLFSENPLFLPMSLYSCVTKWAFTPETLPIDENNFFQCCNLILIVKAAAEEYPIPTHRELFYLAHQNLNTVLTNLAGIFGYQYSSQSPQLKPYVEADIWSKIYNLSSGSKGSSSGASSSGSLHPSSGSALSGKLGGAAVGSKIPASPPPSPYKLQLAKEGFTDVIGDGNCLVRAIAKCMICYSNANVPLHAAPIFFPNLNLSICISTKQPSNITDAMLNQWVSENSQLSILYPSSHVPGTEIATCHAEEMLSNTLRNSCVTATTILINASKEDKQSRSFKQTQWIRGFVDAVLSGVAAGQGHIPEISLFQGFLNTCMSSIDASSESAQKSLPSQNLTLYHCGSNKRVQHKEGDQSQAQLMPALEKEARELIQFLQERCGCSAQDSKTLSNLFTQRFESDSVRTFMDQLKTKSKIFSELCKTSQQKWATDKIMEIGRSIAHTKATPTLGLVLSDEDFFDGSGKRQVCLFYKTVPADPKKSLPGTPSTQVLVGYKKITIADPNDEASKKRNNDLVQAYLKQLQQNHKEAFQTKQVTERDAYFELLIGALTAVKTYLERPGSFLGKGALLLMSKFVLPETIFRIDSHHVNQTGSSSGSGDPYQFISEFFYQGNSVHPSKLPQGLPLVFAANVGETVTANQHYVTTHRALTPLESLIPKFRPPSSASAPAEAATQGSSSATTPAAASTPAAPVDKHAEMKPPQTKPTTATSSAIGSSSPAPASTQPTVTQTQTQTLVTGGRLTAKQAAAAFAASRPTTAEPSSASAPAEATTQGSSAAASTPAAPVDKHAKTKPPQTKPTTATSSATGSLALATGTVPTSSSSSGKEKGKQSSGSSTKKGNQQAAGGPSDKDGQPKEKRPRKS